MIYKGCCIGNLRVLVLRPLDALDINPILELQNQRDKDEVGDVPFKAIWLTISHRGDISRSLWTCWHTFCTTKSISSSVVKRPIPNRMELWAISSSAPKARNTYEGSREADVHADPEERAMSFNAINRDSPSTYAKERLTHPGNVALSSPFRVTCSTLAVMPSINRLANRSMRSWSYYVKWKDSSVIYRTSIQQSAAIEKGGSESVPQNPCTWIIAVAKSTALCSYTFFC